MVFSFFIDLIMKIDKKTEFKINDIFQFGITQLKCIESDDGYCYGCKFENFQSCEDIISFTGPCSGDKRKDGIDAIFIQI